jgi:hypothetical protein
MEQKNAIAVLKKIIFNQQLSTRVVFIITFISHHEFGMVQVAELHVAF